MSRSVKRSCRTCGWSGEYASAAKADYAKRQHSCEKWTRKIAGQERRAAQLSAVDRTPKKCLHKVAQHEHGTRACYVLDRCRCVPCSKANRDAENMRSRQKAYCRYDKYVDAQPVRDHLDDLKAYGIGLKYVSKLSGVSVGSLTKIYYGTYASIQGPSQGRYGAGELLRGPAKRVLRTTAERLFAVQAVPENLPPTALDPHRTDRARLYLRALVALGWSQSKLAARLGMQAGNFGRVVSGDAPMKRQTVDAVLALYDDLSMTLPPQANQRDRIAASRSRAYAKARGWRPPLDLEVLELDHDESAHHIDDVAIERRMSGDRSIRLSKAEQAILVERWLATGRTGNECERITGVNVHRYKPKAVAA